METFDTHASDATDAAPSPSLTPPVASAGLLNDASAGGSADGSAGAGLAGLSPESASSVAPTAPFAREPERFAREPEQPAPPRIRWAAVIWGLVLGAIAVAALAIVIDADRSAAVTDWLVGLTPLSAWAIAILVVGGLLLVTGLVGLVRRTQRPAEASRI